ncbi:hypothetical protein GCK72_004262 [Caenorhabditis remanei]|nr:hypothetical protein GCK72_004262 [Caenorhabditis remanei]KAF1764315.1 hypothetical protein GCK72_004262 [Caenorhabditis remanei]
MKIFMILLLALLTISTVSAFTDTARTGIVCKTHQNCGFSARCIQGHCMPVPGTLIGRDGPSGEECHSGCYECVEGKCIYSQV